MKHNNINEADALGMVLKIVVAAAVITACIGWVLKGIAFLINW